MAHCWGNSGKEKDSEQRQVFCPGKEAESVTDERGLAHANTLQTNTLQGPDAAHVQALAAYKGLPHSLERRRPRHPVLKEAKAEYVKLQ
jgi:hypothetical protein